MSNSLTRTQQSKVAGDLKAALITAGHKPIIEANWEPNFELTVGQGSHMSATVAIFAGSRSIKINNTQIDGDQFSGRGFTDKMVAAILDAVPAPPAPAPAPDPEPAPAASSKKTKAEKKGKPAKKDLGGPPPKRGIKLA